MNELDGAGELSLPGLVDGLQALCAAVDFRSFYEAAVERFGTPAAVGQALELHARLERLALMASEISGTRTPQSGPASRRATGSCVGSTPMPISFTTASTISTRLGWPSSWIA